MSLRYSPQKGLSQFQAKESTEINNEIIELIINELKRMRVNKIDKVSLTQFKSILKKLKLNDYYEHIPYIKSKITNKPAPTISREIENEFKKMFDLIQEPFEKYCPKTRINFLSYSYILNKFCCIKNLPQYKSYFPLLKNPQKLAFHDQIFE